MSAGVSPTGTPPAPATARWAGRAARCRAGPAPRRHPSGRPAAARRPRPPRRGTARSRRGRVRGSVAWRSHAASASSASRCTAGCRALVRAGARARSRRHRCTTSVPSVPAGRWSARRGTPRRSGHVPVAGSCHERSYAKARSAASRYLGVARRAEQSRQSVADARGAVRVAAEVVHRGPAGIALLPTRGRAACAGDQLVAERGCGSRLADRQQGEQRARAAAHDLGDTRPGARAP